MVTPIQTFDFAHKRAEHFLALYDILHDQRRRKVRSDWANSFKELMHWPKSEEFVRVDGGNSILIMREELGISRDEFQHDFVSELLRASLAFSVSAMDLFFHDSVVYWSWEMLRQAEEDIPRELKKVSLPILVTKRVVEQLRRKPNARPSGKIKKELQEILHKETFQSSNGVKKAFNMLDIDDCWTKVANELGVDKPKVISSLDEIVKRRNKIVHEADMVLKTKAKSIEKREVSRTEVGRSVDFIRKFVAASDVIINA